MGRPLKDLGMLPAAGWECEFGVPSDCRHLEQRVTPLPETRVHNKKHHPLVFEHVLISTLLISPCHLAPVLTQFSVSIGSSLESNSVVSVVVLGITPKFWHM